MKPFEEGFDPTYTDKIDLDVDRDLALEKAFEEGEADMCSVCGQIVMLDDVVDFGGKPYCEDHEPEVL